jgi:hypothetical protein
MRDVLLILLVLGFFALATAYVKACATVVRSREESDSEVTA